MFSCVFFFFFSSRRRHTRCLSDWSSDVCSSDLAFDSNVLKPPRPFSICSGTDIAFFVDSEEYQSEMKDERFEMRSQYDFRKARIRDEVKRKAESRRQKAARALSAYCLVPSAYRLLPSLLS